MASEHILQFDVLLAPIPGDNPAGADLRADTDPNSPYYKLKDARYAARAKEREMDAAAEAADLAEWRTILELAPALLASSTKDLELSAWLIEALLRRHGFAGLRDGFRLVRGLVENFWEHLYPLPDEDGIIAKVAPLTALNGEGADGTLIQPMRKVMLTAGRDPGPFAAWHYKTAETLAQKMATLSDEGAREWHDKAGTATMEQIEASRRATPPSFFIELVDDIRQCLAEFASLTGVLDKACGKDSPPASTIRSTLESILDVAMNLGRDALAAAAATAEGQAATDGGGEGAAGSRPTSGGPGLALAPIRGREEAFGALLQIAGYLRRTEPQSVIPYAIEEVVRRGRMPLPELLGELIKDASQRTNFYVVAGMKPPEEQT